MRSITRLFAAFILSACLFLSAKRTSYADLVVTSDGVAVHDTTYDIYWLRDMTIFDHLSYDEQMEAIPGYGDGHWLMARLEDITALDGSPDADIHDTFLPAAQSSVKGVNVDIYYGRIDFKFGPDTHMIGHMSWNTTDDILFSELTYLGNGGSDAGAGPDGQGGFPAWVIYDGVYIPDDGCPDLTGDDQVGPADLAIVLGNWGPVPPNDPIADLNDDGVVGPPDVAILIGNWGSCK